MKIIAIDSSGLTATVALAEDDNLIAEYDIQYKKTHSQTLLPMLDEIKKMVELDLTTVDAVAIAKGPGSFTGLRIGSATAKGLAGALDIPIIEIGTLEGLSMNMLGSDMLICPMMDARRGQVYSGLYSFEYEGDAFTLITHIEQCALSAEDMLEKVKSVASESGKKICFLGDGIPVFKSVIDAKMNKNEIFFAPCGFNRQRAAAFMPLAMQKLRRGETVSCDEHAPTYLRLSQAERERNEGIRNKGSNY